MLLSKRDLHFVHCILLALVRCTVCVPHTGHFCPLAMTLPHLHTIAQPVVTHYLRA
ncbi:hypothetical protein RKD45_002194 [Streptomyces griseus]